MNVILFPESQSGLFTISCTMALKSEVFCAEPDSSMTAQEGGIHVTEEEVSVRAEIFPDVRAKAAEFPEFSPRMVKLGMA